MKTAMHPVRRKVAIVGFGFMGRTHYGIWRKLSGASVVAVCDSNLSQITAKVKGNLDTADNSALPKSVKVYADFDEMLAKESLDIVDVTLPTPFHPVMAEKALARGLDVLCEKPMAIDARTCDRMLAAQKKHGGLLFVAQCVRFWPEYTVLKEYVESGRYGKVVSADFYRYSPRPGWNNGGKSWFLDESKSGGVALDFHLHDTDFIHFLFGMPKSVTSTSHVGEGGWTDYISTSYGYDGMVVTSSCSWAMAPTFSFEAGFRVVFEKAVVMHDGLLKEPFLVYPEKGRPFAPKVPKMSGYEAEIRHFLAMASGGKVRPVVTAKDARNSVAIVDAERKSARIGRTVKLG